MYANTGTISIYPEMPHTAMHGESIDRHPLKNGVPNTAFNFYTYTTQWVHDYARFTALR